VGAREAIGKGEKERRLAMWPTLMKSSKEDLFPLVRFRDSLDRFFDDFLEAPVLPAKKEGNGKMFVPAVDLKETENALIMETELPGLESKDITVQVEGDLLSIRGERKQEKEEKTRTYYRQECSYGVFERHVRLPAEIDRDKVEAAYLNGVLKVTLPKKAGAQLKSVTIKVK
jgi:HSP20 family protein